MDAKAKRCFDEKVKGFRVLDTETNKVEIVRDVKFLLNEFSSVKSENSDGNKEKDVATIENGSDSNVEENELEPNLAPATPEVASTSNQDAPVQQQKITACRGTILDGIDENNIVNSRLRDRTGSIQEEDLCLMSMAFLAMNEEPQTYDEAINSIDKDKWIAAMDDEYNSLLRNNTSILVDKPSNQKVVDNKWVFKVKQNPNGSIERYRARLVGRGFTQQYGVDYDETFSPVVRFTSI